MSVSEGRFKEEIPCTDIDFCCTPEFIYGGPFIHNQNCKDPIIDAAAPRMVELQGTFKKSYAYYSLKERLPVILTKVIDTLSRGSIKLDDIGATDKDIRSYIQFIAKLKNELVTNKEYAPFTIDTEEANKWNEWISNQDAKRYFNNIWVFSECYVYRKLREGCELYPSLINYDPFEEQKEKAFESNLELMCIVAETASKMMAPSEKEQRKNDFMTLLKICMWANKCDLSFSVGKQVTLAGNTRNEEDELPYIDPFQMIVDNKNYLLADDSKKIADKVQVKAESIKKAMEKVKQATTFKFKCSCERLAKLAAVPICEEEKPEDDLMDPDPPAAEAELPKIPCPAKMLVAQSLIFDIVCDNAGYELFTDLCVGHFLIAQKIVEKVRFHVKKYPWFISDVTPKDFMYLVESCKNAIYNRTVELPPKPAPKGGVPPPPDPPRTITAEAVKTLAQQWAQFLDNGTWLLMAEDYWTWPHLYKDMKKYDYNLYRKLQYSVAIMFKGDLNHRKLLGEKNWNPYTSFEASLQGFIPAPIISLRTVKSELISGLPKGKFEAANKIDEMWMRKGIFGVIQYCPKGEPLKVSERPCIDYCLTCYGKICPEHTDM